MSQKQEFCKKYGHNAKQLAEYWDALLEVCIECGKDLHYYKAKDGTIDNERYHKDHLRDFAQPVGKTAGIFQKFYGHRKFRTKDEREEEERFWKDRDAQRVENWEHGMKARDDGAFVKKVKSIVKGS